MLKVQDVAERLNVTTKTVTRWIEDGKLPAYRFGKDFRIKKEDFDEFVNSSKVQSN